MFIIDGLYQLLFLLPDPLHSQLIFSAGHAFTTSLFSLFPTSTYLSYSFHRPMKSPTHLLTLSVTLTLFSLLYLQGMPSSSSLSPSLHLRKSCTHSSIRYLFHSHTISYLNIISLLSGGGLTLQVAWWPH